MDESTLFRGILIAIAVVGGGLVALFVRAYYVRRRHDAYLAQHGIDGRARVIGARRSHVSINGRRGWIVVVAWRDPQTGTDHQLESDLVFEPIALGEAPRARYLAAGELPVRVDPANPEKFHDVDISSLQQ